MLTAYLLSFPFVEGQPKEFGPWANDGACVALEEGKTCGPGLQKQTRTCINCTTDKSTDVDTMKNISCMDAGTALPKCG